MKQLVALFFFLSASRNAWPDGHKVETIGSLTETKVVAALRAGGERQRLARGR